MTMGRSSRLAGDPADVDGPSTFTLGAPAGLPPGLDVSDETVRGLLESRSKAIEQIQKLLASVKVLGEVRQRYLIARSARCGIPSMLKRLWRSVLRFFLLCFGLG
jgi:hypothetical protein